MSVVASADQRPFFTFTGERLLLTLAGAFVFVNFAALNLLQSTSLSDWLHFAVWVVCAIVGQIWLERRLPKRDPLIFPLIMFLSGWGLVLIDRLAPLFADRQTVWLALSVAVLMLVSTLPHALRWLRSYRYILLLIGLILLIGTIILGRNPSGLSGAPELWLGIGSIFFQPSEALKIILVAFLASYLAEQYPLMRASTDLRQTFSPRVFGPILLMWGLSIVILVWQRDLGTAILFFIIFMTLLYIASGSWWIILSGVALIIVAGLVAYRLFDVVQLRVDIWINPWPESDNRAFQIVQSLLAFAAGGIFGQGVGQGSPTFIPVVHSDFIFAAIGEEWGLLGSITLIAVIAILVARGMRIALRQGGQSFKALLAAGLSLLLAVQTLMIMGGVLKLIPLTGVTLPFLSYGGSSLLMTFVNAGLLLRLSAGEDDFAN